MIEKNAKDILKTIQEMTPGARCGRFLADVVDEVVLGPVQFAEHYNAADICDAVAATVYIAVQKRESLRAAATAYAHAWKKIERIYYRHFNRGQEVKAEVEISRKVAEQYRREQTPYRGTGLVVVNGGRVAGWIDRLNNPQYWPQGYFVVDVDGGIWVAAGGVEDRAARWEPVLAQCGREALKMGAA